MAKSDNEESKVSPTTESNVQPAKLNIENMNDTETSLAASIKINEALFLINSKNML